MRGDGQGTDKADRQRIDKWLWQARFFKTRALAAAVAGAGHMRLNGSHVKKPAQAVRPGDTLTFPQGQRVRVVRILALPARRGPASEAQTLYEDLGPPPAPRDPSAPEAGPAPDRRARAEARRLRGSGA